jgi:fucose permease
VDTIVHLLKNKTVIVFFFGIFAYVGTEQGVANWISEFLKTYHGLRPEVEGAQAVQWYWGLIHHGSFSGILCSGIMGGAVTPLIVGSLADHFGLRIGMLFNYVTLSFLLFLSFWAKPMIVNKTIFSK